MAPSVGNALKWFPDRRLARALTGFRWFRATIFYLAV
jgi:hypothetical protein